MFKRDQRKGYAPGFYDFLCEVESGEEFLEKIRPTSIRNGAAMRAPVIGMLPGIDSVMEKSELQARLTHDTRIGVDSAVAASLMAHYFAYDIGSKEDLPGFLSMELPRYDWRPKRIITATRNFSDHSLFIEHFGAFTGVMLLALQICA